MTLAQLIALSYWVELVQIAEKQKLSDQQFDLLNKAYSYLFDISENTTLKLSIETINKATPILTKLFETVNLDIQKLQGSKEPIKILKCYNETELERSIYNAELSVTNLFQKTIKKARRKKVSYYIDKQELQPYQIWARILDGVVERIKKNKEDATKAHYNWREIPMILACFAWRNGTSSVVGNKVNFEEINRKADVLEQINAETAYKAYDFFLSTCNVSSTKPTFNQYLQKYLIQTLQAVAGAKNTGTNGDGKDT